MKVAFIGVGTMGRPMAANLVKGGHEVLVLDADAQRATEVAAEIGATATEMQALAEVDAFITMLPDGKVVREVALGTGGIHSVARAGALVIDMSSSQPLITQETGAALAAKGIVMIDAPVSGAVPRAQTGSLTIMIGADDPDSIEKARPLLQCMGTTLFPVGRLGAGHAAKALNNVVAATNFAVAAEALGVAESYGLNPETLVDILNVSTGQSFISASVLKQFVLSGSYASGFKVGLLAKDVGIASELSTALGCQTPFIQLAQQRWDAARDHLGAGEDHTRAALVWKKAAGSAEPQSTAVDGKPMNNEAFARGMALRREMFGPAGADQAFEKAGELSRPLQEMVTRFCFGEVWQRPGLARKTRSLLTLSMLIGTGRFAQFPAHLRGAVANGVSREELRELILHAQLYCGIPSAVEAMALCEATLGA